MGLHQRLAHQLLGPLLLDVLHADEASVEFASRHGGTSGADHCHRQQLSNSQTEEMKWLTLPPRVLGPRTHDIHFFCGLEGGPKESVLEKRRKKWFRIYVARGTISPRMKHFACSTTLVAVAAYRVWIMDLAKSKPKPQPTAKQAHCMHAYIGKPENQDKKNDAQNGQTFPNWP